MFGLRCSTWLVKEHCRELGLAELSCRLHWVVGSSNNPGSCWAARERPAGGHCTVLMGTDLCTEHTLLTWYGVISRLLSVQWSSGVM